jgi:regulator of sigma E protease
MSLLSTVLIFLVVLSVLVLAHELGHFVLAKRAGIKVQEFGFGYPPRLFGVRVGETIYSLNLLPLGGFVKMLGENGSPDVPRSFASKSRKVRAAVLVAGSAMNLLLAPVLFSVGYMVGEPMPCESCERVQVYGVQPGSPAAQAGMEEGDLFVSIDGRPIRSTEDVRAAVRAAGEREIEVVVERNGQVEHLRLTPRLMTPQGQTQSQLMIGIALGPEVVTVRYPPWQALPLGVRRTVDTLVIFLDGLRQVVVRQAPAEVAGPVGIAQMTGQAAEAGLVYLVNFTAFLSLNLSIFNLLPIPGLDGARLLFVVIEGARGRRINPQVEGVIHFVGLMLLITLMLFVSYNDVRRLIPS